MTIKLHAQVMPFENLPQAAAEIRAVLPLLESSDPLEVMATANVILQTVADIRLTASLISLNRLASAGIAALLLGLVGCAAKGPPPLPVVHQSFAAVSAPVVLMPASTVSLAWDASPSENVTGYKVYWGLNQTQLTNVVPFGNQLKATLGPLTPGTSYWFAASAFDAAGNESGLSNFASYTVPANASNNVPVTTVTIIGQWATQAAGPWTSYPVPVYSGPATNSKQVFRLQITTTP